MGGEVMHVTVYDKGEAFGPEGFRTMNVTVNRSFKRVPLPNIVDGREAHTYLWHIIANYHNLAEWNVFTQGQPHKHFPGFNDFLNAFSFDRDQWNNKLQCLTCQWQSGAPDYGCEDNTPVVYSIDKKTAQVLEPRPWQDLGVQEALKIHSDDIGVASSEIVSDFFKQIGLSVQQDTLDFCYGACFVVHRDNILQHPLETYIKMWKYLMTNSQCRVASSHCGLNCTDCRAHEVAGYIIERLWFTIFS